MRLLLFILVAAYYSGLQAAIPKKNLEATPTSAAPKTDASAPLAEEVDETDDTKAIDADTAHLQVVDKITGRFSEITAKVGETTLYQSLKISVSTCKLAPPFAPPESKVFLSVWEHPKGYLPHKLFSGWMFASSPAVSTLTNHPRYNLWLIKCTKKEKNTEKK